MRINWDSVEIEMAEKRVGVSALAGLMGLSQPRVSQIRKAALDGKDFGPDLVGRLARALGVPVTRIVKGLNVKGNAQ